LYLFVYGTLKKGCKNHKILINPESAAEFYGEGKIRGSMYDLGDYPAIILDDTAWIMGEIYRITEREIRILDRFEEVPGLYQRSIIRVNDLIEAWVYHMQPEQVENRPQIKNGCWKKK